MKQNTLTLAAQLKLERGNLTPNVTPYPAMPALPERKREEVYGNDEDQGCFLYGKDGEGLSLVGVREEDKPRQRLVLPTHHEGKYVLSLSQGLLAGCAQIRQVHIQANIPLLYDGLFASCPNLEEIHLSQTVPAFLQVGWNLLEGAPKAKIYVPRASLSAYQSDYFWSHYSGRMVGE